MTLVATVFLTILAYLVGSVPFGLLIAKTQGKDIRKMGSGNIGATNVLRCFGKPLGIICFILDVLKGFLPALLFPALGTGTAGLGILFGAAAILGHNFPVFLGFKGGKGVATSAGVLLGVAPFAVAVGLLVWFVVFYASGYVSLGSIIAALAVVLAAWFRLSDYGILTVLALTLLGGLTVWRHRANIQRLRNGTENKFTKKSKV